MQDLDARLARRLHGMAFLQLASTRWSRWTIAAEAGTEEDVGEDGWARWWRSLGAAAARGRVWFRPPHGHRRRSVAVVAAGSHGASEAVLGSSSSRDERRRRLRRGCVVLAAAGASGGRRRDGEPHLHAAGTDRQPHVVSGGHGRSILPSRGEGDLIISSSRRGRSSSSWVQEQQPEPEPTPLGGEARRGRPRRRPDERRRWRRPPTRGGDGAHEYRPEDPAVPELRVARKHRLVGEGGDGSVGGLHPRHRARAEPEDDAHIRRRRRRGGGRVPAVVPWLQQGPGPGQRHLHVQVSDECFN